MSGVFTDPLFLPNMVNSVFELVRPVVVGKAPPFTAADDKPTTPMESVNDRGDPENLILLPAHRVHPQQRRAK